MIVGVCGFSWSGSGAVIDYLMEFNNNQVYIDEFIIAYHPDGIHDLDQNINENCAKFLSSGVAIPRFRKVANSLLLKSTKGESKRLVEDYLNSIIQAKWVGLEQGQELLHNRWVYKNIGLRIRDRIITKLSPDWCWKHKPYPLNEMCFSICPSNFITATQKFTNEVLKSIGLNTQKNIVLNQPFPGNNPVPYMKYFLDSRAIVVDRDPRDVFAFLKYIFPGHSYSVPLQEVDAFCEYYEHMHKDLEKKVCHPDVLYVHFEDLVYKYNDTTEQIKAFLGLDKSATSKQFFVPEESEANTQIYEQFGNAEENDIIQTKLEKYLYDFSSVKKKNKTNKVFDDNPKSINYHITSK